jgi:phosphate:Na+ symporter
MLIAGFANVDTRRMAWGNLLFVLAGVVVCVPLVPELATWLRAVSPAGDAQVIANAHTLFNVALAVVFLPLVPLVARLLERFVQAREPAEEKFGPRYLDPSCLSSPALALGQASREILRMADIVQEMLRNAHRAFQENNPALCDETQQMDDKVDLLSSAIKTYITKLSEQALTAPESQREMAVLSFCIELEGIGDIIDKNLIDAAKKKLSLQVAFSKDGWAELDQFFQEVLGNFQIAVNAFTNRDTELAETLLRNKQKIDEEELELRNRHFHRLHEGLAESIETSAIHLDVLAYLRAINSHLTSVAHPILDNKPS